MSAATMCSVVNNIPCNKKDFAVLHYISEFRVELSTHGNTPYLGWLFKRILTLLKEAK